MNYVPRLQTKYKEEVKDAMMAKFTYKNHMQIPQVQKIVLNQGVGAATKMLQKTLGTVQDGVIGDVTLRLANRGNAEDATIYLSERALRYAATRNFDTFGRGWMNRIFKLARHV